MKNKKTSLSVPPMRPVGRPKKINAVPDIFAGLRVSPALYERIKTRAEADRRSINQTMNYLLEFALNNLDYKKL